MSTPFNAYAGTKQLRVQPQDFPAIISNHVFVLGQDQTRHRFWLNVGDSVQVYQTSDFLGAKLLSFSCRVRDTDFPMPTSPNLKWKVSLLIDAFEAASHIIERTRELFQLNANISKAAPGNHTVTLKLELVQV